MGGVLVITSGSAHLTAFCNIHKNMICKIDGRCVSYHFRKCTPYNILQHSQKHVLQNRWEVCNIRKENARQLRILEMPPLPRAGDSTAATRVTAYMRAATRLGGRNKVRGGGLVYCLLRK